MGLPTGGAPGDVSGQLGATQLRPPEATSLGWSQLSAASFVSHMCGLCGFLELGGGFNEQVSRATLTRMIARLRHRGPDDSGTWIDGSARIALGHTRLSILDLSPEGHQPMLSANGRFVLVFNGEIYNYRALRRECPERPRRPRGESRPTGLRTSRRSVHELRQLAEQLLTRRERDSEPRSRRREDQGTRFSHVVLRPNRSEQF